MNNEKLLIKQLLIFFMDLLKKLKLKSKHLNETEIIERFFDILKPILIYGSKPVMKQYSNFKSLGIETEKKYISYRRFTY